ncbi:SusC/RagA family TonB-linked outer membrane protein [Hymenobacter baengnokdamensis]|uniref:SusC/RagA family TonB-linked outer membrane protein n=1 Tax=Hymenobacter baengnokdamensis TaxID=2615203 RepID=UPI0012461AA7|nr:TonB-dependent receptor [Hymenobacter baengnokdamensis]
MKKHLLMLWLVLCGSIGLAFAQSRQVSGVVKGSDGETLPGVTVVLKGTTIGASTGADGSFSLSVPTDSKSATLRFSFIGYVSQEVAVGDKTTFNVTLTSDTQSLDDVVVIGYQAVQRRDVTGAVSSVNAQQIKDIPVNSAAEALQGRLAGVQLNASDGTPGNQGFQVRVRGGNSITQDNTPLYVVDGIQVENALGVIAPQDIASVDVLKDASATAIYGARGANGVVIITTKGGKEGRTTVTYSGFTGIRKITKMLPVLNPTDYVNYQYERASQIGTSTGGLSTFKSYFGTTDYNSARLDSARNAPFLDWQKQVFGRNAMQQTHNVSISGGNKGTTYSLSLTKNNEDGIQLGSSYNRYLMNFRMDNKVSDKFRFGFNTRFNSQESLGAGTGAAVGTATNGQAVPTGSNTTSRLRNTIQYVPLAVPATSHSTALDPNVFDADFFNNSSLVNPVLAINDEYRSDKRRTLNLAANAALNITKDLVLRSTAGIDITDFNTSTFNGRNSPTIRQVSGGYNNLPFATITTATQTSLNNSNVLDYTFRHEKHTLNLLAGEEIYQQQTRQQYIQTNYLPIDITAQRALANINQGVLPAGTTSQPVLPTTSIPNDYTLLSFFGRANYSYDDKYLLTLTGRQDGSSKFLGFNNQHRFFPAASAAWRISKENFMQDVKPVSDLKLRLSYGQAGNNRINDFLYSQLFQAGSAVYYLNHQQVLGSTATGLANPNLQWEVTTSRDAGIDLAMFNNRVQFTTDVYYNTTDDLLVNRPVPAFLGYTSQLQNIGRTSNRGLEFQVSGTVIQTQNFTWSATANASLNRNRIEDLGPNLNEFYLSSGWAGTASTIPTDYVVRVGQPVGLMYGFVSDGFYTTDDFSGYDAVNKVWKLRTDKPVANDLSVTGLTSLAPGVVKLKDLNGDGVVDVNNDRTVIGNANPKVTGGLNQQFTYKNFDASIFVNFVYGNDIYNANKIEFTTAAYPLTNLLGEEAGRYRSYDNNGVLVTDPAALNALNQNATVAAPSRQFFLQSSDIEKGSFLRLNNITLGYSLSKSLIQRAKVNQLRFYVTMNNLATLTGYSGYDPEVNTRRATPLTPGVDYAAYPRSKAFLFGVNLSL